MYTYICTIYTYIYTHIVYTHIYVYMQLSACPENQETRAPCAYLSTSRHGHPHRQYNYGLYACTYLRMSVLGNRRL